MFASHRGRATHPAAADFGGQAFAQNSMLDVEFAELSDVGRLRQSNQDCLGHVVPETPEQICSHGWLFVLADGVGGQARGELASSTAVDTLVTGFRKAVPGELASGLLQRLVQHANTQVYETGRSTGLGGTAIATTVVACIIRHDRVAIAHVGDSRCYLVRRSQARALTRDHTLVGDQVRLGIMSAEAAASAKTRHVLSRSVGHDLFVNVDVNEHQIFAGDTLVLCCDGLHGAVSGGEIASILGAHHNLEIAAKELVALANQKDGSDNISLQIIRIRNVERVGMYRGRPYKLR